MNFSECTVASWPGRGVIFYELIWPRRGFIFYELIWPGSGVIFYELIWPGRGVIFYELIWPGRGVIFYELIWPRRGVIFLWAYLIGRWRHLLWNCLTGPFTWACPFLRFSIIFLQYMLYHCVYKGYVGGCRGCDRMIVWFTTTSAISAYHQVRTLWVRIPPRRDVHYTTLSDKVCQLLSAGRWFSPGTPVSSTNTTDLHDITEILLTVALNTITLIINGKFKVNSTTQTGA